MCLFGCVEIMRIDSVVETGGKASTLTELN